MPGTTIRLDNPAFAGRLKINSRRSSYERRVVMSRPRTISDFRISASPHVSQAVKKTAAPVAVHRAKPKSASRRQMRSRVLMRQLVHVQKNVGRRRRANLKSVALTALATILFVFGLGVGIVQLHTNQKVKAQVQTLAAHTQAADDSGNNDAAVNVPSETKPSGTGTYRVAPDIPEKLSIPRLGIDARVLRLGLKTNGEIKTPNNIYDTGWYEGSAKPGELGAVFIDGHVHGPTMPGVFVGIKKLKVGDKLSLTRGDGKVFSYHVVKSQSYDKDKVDMGAAFNSAVPGKPGLNMITCDGSYTEAGEYNKRIIVFAVQD